MVGARLIGASSTTWSYDLRGRLIQESKTITGLGTYATQWTYNSADLPVTMTYPDGELLSFTYHPQLALDTLMSNRDPSNQANNYYLVQQTVYDSAGRVDFRSLGAPNLASDPTMVNDYTYNFWNVQGGRLQRLNAGMYDSQAGLLDLSYTYDLNGNMTNIVDARNSGQKQCFSYDALDWLTSARAGDSDCNGSLGNGEYADESYAYDPNTGNLSSKTGMGTYTYNATHKHAVAITSAGWAYDYDNNGNMTRRDPPGSDYYDLAYDAENRLIEVKKNGTVIASFTYDGDGARVKSVINSATTVFAGAHYEVSGSTVTNYNSTGSGRIALRRMDHSLDRDPLYLHGPCGAYLAQHKMGINDPLVLEAISQHSYMGNGTVRSPVFCWCLRFADMLEPGRDWHDVRLRLQPLVFTGRMIEAAHQLLDWLLPFPESVGVTPHPHQIALRQKLEKLHSGRQASLPYDQFPV